MAYGITATANASATGSSTTRTVTISPNAGDTVLLAIRYFSGSPPTISSIEDQAASGITYSEPQAALSQNNWNQHLAVCENVVSGITTITVTLSGSVNFFVQATSISGVATLEASSSNSQVDPGLGTDNVVSGTLAMSGKTGVLVGYSLNCSGGSVTEGTGFTSLTDSDSRSASEYMSASGAGTTEALFSNGAGAAHDFHTHAVFLAEPQTDTTTYTATPLAGNSYVDLTSVATVGQIITTAALATGDQLRYENVTTPGSYAVTVNADATFSIDGAAPDGVYTFEVRAWDSSDQTWGTAADQSVTIGSVASSGKTDSRIFLGIGIGL